MLQALELIVLIGIVNIGRDRTESLAEDGAGVNRPGFAGG
jgi:hypothetical protein